MGLRRMEPHLHRHPYTIIYLHAPCALDKSHPLTKLTVLNISVNSKVVTQSCKLSSVMSKMCFEIEFVLQQLCYNCKFICAVRVVFMSPQSASGTVSIHTCYELHNIAQFLAPARSHDGFVSVDCLYTSCEFIQGSVRRIVKQNCVYCYLVSTSADFVSTIVCLKPLLCKYNITEHFSKYVGRSCGKVCCVLYLGYFNTTRVVPKVRYQLSLWHCMNTTNFST